MKSVNKESKLSLIVMTMIVEKIHRILINDSDSKMIISVLNFKDIFLYLLKLANEYPLTEYTTIDIHSIIEMGKSIDIHIEEEKPLWEAFEIMTDRQKSLWITVVDEEGRFKGMLFREDFRGIFQGWHVHYLWMSVGDFIQLKNNNHTGNIPEFRFFQPSDVMRDVIWKVVMTKRNAIVWVSEDNRVQATIGLMELFSLYVSWFTNFPLSIYTNIYEQI